MALGDYILCCKCEVKLIYDGDRGQREWWEERFGKPPEIECPDCKTQRTWVGLTDEEVAAAARMLSDRQAAACNVDCGDMWKLHGNDFIDDARAALEAAHGIKGEA